VADVSMMMMALANESKYESDHGLTDSDLMALGDIDGSGTFNNLDIQALISLMANGGGTGSLTAVPEPTSAYLLAVGVNAMAIAARRGRRR
jgi:hypothetical protein